MTVTKATAFPLSFCDHRWLENLAVTESAQEVLKPIKAKAWTPEESRAVEKHMMNSINTCCVPGKADCYDCLSAEPPSLKKQKQASKESNFMSKITLLNSRKSLKRKRLSMKNCKRF